MSGRRGCCLTAVFLPFNSVFHWHPRMYRCGKSSTKTDTEGLEHKCVYRYHTNSEWSTSTNWMFLLILRLEWRRRNSDGLTNASCSRGTNEPFLKHSERLHGYLCMTRAFLITARIGRNTRTWYEENKVEYNTRKGKNENAYRSEKNMMITELNFNTAWSLPKTNHKLMQV